MGKKKKDAVLYVKDGDRRDAGVVKIAASELATYLFDPTSVPVFDNKGNLIAHHNVKADWPFAVKAEGVNLDDPEAVRAHRQALEDQGIKFQWREATEEEYKKSSK